MEIIKGNLYKSKNNRVIVLAEESSNNDCFSGTVIRGELYNLGHYSTVWATELFRPYSAEIIIKEVIDFSKVQFVELNDGTVLLTTGNHEDGRFYANNTRTGILAFPFKEEVKRVVTAKFK